MNPREQQQMNETLNTLQQRGQIFTEQMFQAKEENWKLEDLCKERAKEVKKKREDVSKRAEYTRRSEATGLVVSRLKG